MSREQVQEEALKEALQHNRCGLGIGMGVGKTRIAIQHLQNNYNPFTKVLVVIPKLSVKDAWIKELQKMNLEPLEDHIVFSTYLSINKQNPNDYDIVYLDECHSLLYNHENFLSVYTGKILGLTGTPPKRRGSEKYRMVQRYCPMKYTFTVDDASDSRILNQYKIVIHQLQLSRLNTIEKLNKTTGGKWYTSEVNDYEYHTNRLIMAQTQKGKQMAGVMRMKSMMNYTTKEDYTMSLLANMNEKCIIFANTQKQADRMCSYSFHSANPNSKDNLELFSDGRIDKLSCVLQLSEGVSIPGLKQGIIMHAYGNERKSSQRIGRLLRLNPDDVATCHILCYINTQDEKWVESALSTFDQNKITHYNPLTN